MTLMPVEESRTRLNEKGLLTFSGQSHLVSYKRPEPVSAILNVMYVTRDHFYGVSGSMFAGCMTTIETNITGINTAYSLPQFPNDFVVFWTVSDGYTATDVPSNNGQKVPVTSRKFTFNESHCHGSVIFKFVKRTKEIDRVVALTMLNQ